MVVFLVLYLERIKRTRGLAAAQQIYRGLFSNPDNLEYKEAVDAALTIDGHSDIIVEV